MKNLKNLLLLTIVLLIFNNINHVQTEYLS